MRAIKRSQKFEELVRKLAVDEHPITKKSIFPTIRELMCFAAVLGFENNHRSKLQDATNDVEGRIFLNSQQSLDLIYLIALASEKDGDILREEKEDRMIQVFEEYAQGGFEILEQWMKEKPGDLYGDEAILEAFSKYGFLEREVDPEFAVAEISFA
jgi:dnd system-associated protein 4